MLYHILYPLHKTISVFNVFQYITFRTIYASLTAFLITFFLGPWTIRKLRELQIGQYIREVYSMGQAWFKAADQLQPQNKIARVLAEEHRIYPQTVRWFAEGRLQLVGRHVVVKDGQGAGALRSPAC